MLSHQFHRANLQSLHPLLPALFYLNLVHPSEPLSFPITQFPHPPFRNPHRPKTSPLRLVGFKVAVSCKIWSEPASRWRMRQNLSRVLRRRGLVVDARVPSWIAGNPILYLLQRQHLYLVIPHPFVRPIRRYQ